MRAEKYIDRSQLESNIRAQRIPYKLLRDTLNILETYDKYLNIWKEKKEDWTKKVNEHFTLSFSNFSPSPQEIMNALNFLQWIPLKDEFAEEIYDKRKLTLEGFFIGIRVLEVDGSNPYGEKAISGLWDYVQRDEVRIFLKEYLDNNKEISFDITNNKIILKINKEKKQINKENSPLVCSFRKVGGKNIRFEYLLKLSKSKIKIGAIKLSNKSFQNTSSEIDEINERLKKDLDLTENVIKNDNKSGYEINRDIYQIIFS